MFILHFQYPLLVKLQQQKKSFQEKRQKIISHYDLLLKRANILERGREKERSFQCVTCAEKLFRKN